MAAPSPIAASQRPAEAGPAAVRRRLDEVLRRGRFLVGLAGLGRLVALAAGGLLLLYPADRWLALPRPARAVLVALLLAAFAREAWRRLLRPLLAGPGRLDAARLVERVLPLEGRLVSALQLAPGPPGSFEHRLAEEAAALAERQDLRVVLAARPALREAARGGGALLLLVAGLLLGRPQVDVFVQRWLLRDVAWPRETLLELHVPERSPVHVRIGERLLASRGGTVAVQAGWTGLRPERVELVVESDDGPRSQALVLAAGGRFVGHFTATAGDRRLRVRGGDDPGDDASVALEVLDPPRLDDPRFTLEPPAYLGRAASDVGPEGLAVPEGTTIRVSGRPSAAARSATLFRLGTGQSQELALSDADGAQVVSGAFVAEVSDTLAIVLSGEHGLTTPEAAQHALLVHEDRPPSLRVYAPTRSDAKVTAGGVLPFAVLAEDDHGVTGVSLRLGEAGGLSLARDEAGAFRHVLDLTGAPLTGSVAYELAASDGRDLPGKGPQTVLAAGRRIDVVDAAEIQRLLADRQLRLKEAFALVRERQELALVAVDDLLADLPAPDAPALVAAAVAQNQVTTSLGRETRELCAILDETIFNRLDPGPTAEAVLRRRLGDWSAAPVEQGFDAGALSALAADHAAGSFGRLDVLGRLLEMTGLALDLAGSASPAAHALLAEARQAPDAALLGRAREAQSAVLAGLDRLLERMDEWEDYQEVLHLVRTLIDDQRTLREQSQRALSLDTGGDG